MKALGIFAAVALAATPMLTHAQSSTQSTDSDEVAATPEAGGVSQGGAWPIFGLGGIPAGAVVVGGVVILGGVVIGVVAASQDDSTVSTTGTN